MQTIHSDNAQKPGDPCDSLLSGLFSYDVAPWWRALRFKRLPDSEKNFIRIKNRLWFPGTQP